MSTGNPVKSCIRKQAELNTTGAPPTVSVVIATFNAASTLRRCLDSLLPCDPAEMEIIIKDCCSTDDTLRLVNEYACRRSIRLISQQDTGIYDAWNQALEHEQGPRGHWIIFLGADDFISSPQRMATTIAALRELPDVIEYASCSVTLVNQQDFAVDTLLPSRNLERDLPAGMPLPHQGLFHRRSLFVENRFDATLRISGDFDFLCRTLTSNNLTYLKIPAPVCMSLGGVSGNLEGMAKRNRESLRVSRRYFKAHKRKTLWKRLVLSYGFIGLARTFGFNFAAACADHYRRFSGKTAIWRAAPDLPQRENDSARKGPAFSLLVATINRREPLAQFLESLVRQTVSADSFEVLIADQNPPGFLQPIIDEYSSRLQLRIVQVPNRGVSRARNALLPLAKGAYIAFPDDDCFYEAETLHEAIKFFEEFLHVHAFLGRWLAPDAASVPPSQRSALCNWRSVFWRGETYVQFFRKEAVERIGAFDPVIGPGTGLPYGCGEDTDYLLRAIQAKLTVMFAPSVHVRHPEVDVRTAAKNEAKIRSYATGRMYILYKHQLPLWFQLLNIVYPLTQLFREGVQAVRYRRIMFSARLRSFFSVRYSAAPKEKD